MGHQSSHNLTPHPRPLFRYKAGKPSKDCAWVGDDPSDRCGELGEDNQYAYESCLLSCGECGCADSATWSYKGKSSKDCDWVAKKPEKYCSLKYVGSGAFVVKRCHLVFTALPPPARPISTQVPRQGWCTCLRGMPRHVRELRLLESSNKRWPSNDGEGPDGELPKWFPAPSS